jgi:hypothetical protein
VRRREARAAWKRVPAASSCEVAAVVVVVAVGGTGGVVGAATEIGGEEYGDREKEMIVLG